VVEPTQHRGKRGGVCLGIDSAASARRRSAFRRGRCARMRSSSEQGRL
jgi:hypothetical protein